MHAQTRKEPEITSKEKYLKLESQHYRNLKLHANFVFIQKLDLWVTYTQSLWGKCKWYSTVSTALSVSKRLYRKCPRGAAKTVLPWLLPTACFSPTAFWKSTCKEMAWFHGYLLIIGGAIKFISPTFSSLEHLLLILPTHDLNLGWEIKALLFLISSLIFTSYSLAA